MPNMKIENRPFRLKELLATLDFVQNIAKSESTMENVETCRGHIHTISRSYKGHHKEG